MEVLHNHVRTCPTEHVKNIILLSTRPKLVTLSKNIYKKNSPPYKSNYNVK